MLKTDVSMVPATLHLCERPKNRLLARLPVADFNRLRPHLTTIPVHAREVFHTAGEPFHRVYFLNGGVGSITTTLSDGAVVEVATVGDEGMLGIEAFLSDRPVAQGDTLMQVPDTSARSLHSHI
jgi:CRP-like cAMP-binding protein